MSAELEADSQSAESGQEFLGRLLEDYKKRDVSFKFHDGGVLKPSPGQPERASIILNHEGALRRMFWPPNGLSFGESYIFNDFNIEGDITSVIRLGRYLNDLEFSTGDKVGLAWNLFQLPARGPARAVDYRKAALKGQEHSVERDREAVAYHYNLSNDFFGIWLDESLMYTCAYFKKHDDDLATAQRQKVDHVCRKLRLKPGERLLDIGCGWGGLAIHAAQNYGVEALGVTISQPQVDFANERIKRLGLEGRCRVELRDYRDVEALGAFDKLSCIGMLEHVGEPNMPVYFQSAWKLLKPGGALLNHAISSSATLPAKKWRVFARAYVFPDGELYPINVPLKHAEAVGFEVRDVESLREHYALTLRHWLKNLETRRDAILKLTNETTYRVFRLYLAGAIVGFETGIYNLHQALLVKPDDGDARVPLTREDWYGSI